MINDYLRFPQVTCKILPAIFQRNSSKKNWLANKLVAKMEWKLQEVSLKESKHCFLRFICFQWKMSEYWIYFFVGHFHSFESIHFHSTSRIRALSATLWNHYFQHWTLWEKTKLSQIITVQSNYFVLFFATSRLRDQRLCDKLCVLIFSTSCFQLSVGVSMLGYRYHQRLGAKYCWSRCFGNFFLR